MINSKVKKILNFIYIIYMRFWLKWRLKNEKKKKKKKYIYIIFLNKETNLKKKK